MCLKIFMINNNLIDETYNNRCIKMRIFYFRVKLNIELIGKK